MGLNADLLTSTFKRVKTEHGGTTAFGLRFYERLFEKYPAVKPLFTTPPEEQHKKLMASLAVIVSSVNATERLIPYLHAMGIRHLKYKTEEAHYPAVAENLMAVLEEHLSAEGTWEPEMADAWQEAIQVTASIMVDAANNPAKYAKELEQSGYQADGFKANNLQPWLQPA